MHRITQHTLDLQITTLIPDTLATLPRLLDTAQPMAVEIETPIRKELLPRQIHMARRPEVNHSPRFNRERRPTALLVPRLRASCHKGREHLG